MCKEIRFDISNIDDIKRLVSAKAINKKKIVSVDADNQTCVISGSSSTPYQVTLDSCTCADFAIRGLPCKHMLRLAIELGWDDPLPAFDPELAKAYDVNEDIARLEKRWLAGQLTTDAYVACVSALSKSASKAN